MPNRKYRETFVSPEQPLLEVLKNLNHTGLRISLVVDRTDKLLGIVTDPDLRRALLKGVCLDNPVFDFMNTTPVVGQDEMSTMDILEILLSKQLDALPIVNAEGRVVNLALLRDYIEQPESQPAPEMVLMAGGKGKRLFPLTQDTPKPLLPVGGKPILSHILHHVAHHGFHDVTVITHHMAEQIETFLQEQATPQLRLNVIREECPLGTAGSLKSFQSQETSSHPLFVMNADILTTLDFHNMLKWHHHYQNDLTLACRPFQQQVPYGVLELENQQLLAICEKPVHHYNISTGIYLIERHLLSYIPDNEYFDMTDFIGVLIREGKQVGAYPISESWIDIGLPEDYARVNRNLDEFVPVAAR